MDFLSLLPSFGGLIWTLAAFIVALSIIIFVHEFGHYLVGRWSGIEAEVFSIGFGPVLWAVVDRRGTRWQVSVVPLGGYVRFAGDRDAASIRRRRAAEGGTGHGLADAPLWARAATVAAGPCFNFLFSILLFAGWIAWMREPDETPRVGMLYPLPVPVELSPGDRILAIDGQRIETLSDYYRVAAELPGQPSHLYLVEREGSRVSVRGPHPIPPRAASIALNSAARDAGLKAGDVVLAIDGEPVFAFADLPPRVAAKGGESVTLEIWRPRTTSSGAVAGEILVVELTPRRTDLPRPEGGFETRWLIGLTSSAFFVHPTRPVPVSEIVPRAVGQTWDVVERSLSGLKHMVVGAISTCNLSGPVGIARASGAVAQEGLPAFVFFIAVLSTAIGLLNLFPIPILDGGHLVLYAYEALTQRPPSERVLNALMTVGLVILGALMLFALANDLFC